MMRTVLFFKVSFLIILDFFNFWFHQFQNSITLDTDMLLTSSFHQLEALDVA